MIPPYILEHFKEKYVAGKLGWKTFNLTYQFPDDLVDGLERRAMFLMMAADEPDARKRKYWDYNDGKSYDGSFENMIKNNPGQLEGALKLCLRDFVATDDPALLIQRLEFIGNILARHHEVLNAITDKELVDLYMDRAAPLLETLKEGKHTDEMDAILNLYNDAFSLESKIFETKPEHSESLSSKFLSLAYGLLRYDQLESARVQPSAAVSSAKAYLDAHHPKALGS